MPRQVTSGCHPNGQLRYCRNLENSEKEATPTSSPLKERNETKHQKQKEDSGNLTVLDITFGDFNAPITSTPKTTNTSFAAGLGR
ncbi:hypothetical protein quinque_013169 [Culex quinquefasciatus]